MKLKQGLVALNQLKASLQASNEMLAELIEYQLTSEQIGLLLDEDEKLLTEENVALVQKAILKAFEHSLESSPLTPYQLKDNPSDTDSFYINP